MKRNRILKSVLSVALIGAGVGMIPLAFNSTENPIEYVETQDVPADPILDTSRIANFEAMTNDNDDNPSNDDDANKVILEQGGYSFGVEDSEGNITGNLMLTFDATDLATGDLGNNNYGNLYYRVKKSGDTTWGDFMESKYGTNGQIYAGQVNYIDIFEYKDHTGVTHQFEDGETYDIEFYIVPTTATPPGRYDPEVDGYADSIAFSWTQNNSTFSDTSYNKAYPLFDYTENCSIGTEVAVVDFVSTLGFGGNSTNYSIIGYNFTITQVGNTSNTLEYSKINNIDHDGGTESYAIDVSSMSLVPGDQVTIVTELIFEDVTNGWQHSYSLQTEPLIVADKQPATVAVTEPEINDDGTDLEATFDININDPQDAIVEDAIEGGGDIAVVLTGGKGYIDIDDDGTENGEDGTIVNMDLTHDDANNTWNATVNLDGLEYDTQYTIAIETVQNITGAINEEQVIYKSFTTPSEQNPLDPGVLIVEYIDELEYSFTVYGFSLGNITTLNNVELKRKDSEGNVEIASTTGELNGTAITFTDVVEMDYNETYTYWVEYYDDQGSLIDSTNVMKIHTTAISPAAPEGDYDGDGIANESDPDWDFYNPTMDPLLDSDGDLINNKEDDDDDNDGILDGQDHFPFDDDPTEDPMNDEDGDGILNESDTDWEFYNPTMDPELDSDGDGTNNKEDDDDDDDGILDGQDHYPLGNEPDEPTPIEETKEVTPSWVIPTVSTLGALLGVSLIWLAYDQYKKYQAKKAKKDNKTPKEKKVDKSIDNIKKN